MTKDISKLPVSKIKTLLDSLLGKSVWKDLDTDNILLSLRPSDDSSYINYDLLREKINLLKVVEHDKYLFYTDPLFFLHSVCVFNNELADFTTFPTPVSLEMAFAITDMAKVLEVELDKSPVFRTGVIHFIKRALVEDGYPTPIPPFDLVGISSLTYTTPEKDPAKKEQAIKDYVNAMYS
jgi:hypothetical protein